jgi:hypothetical protein
MLGDPCLKSASGWSMRTQAAPCTKEATPSLDLRTPMPRRPRRLLTPLILATAFIATCIAPTATPVVAAPSTSSAIAAGTHSTTSARRLGGHVRRAWPAQGTHRPKTAISRWLARQVGPRKPISCSKRPTQARARCGDRHRKESASVSTSAIAMRTSAANGPRGEAVTLRRISAPSQLQLIRSFDIPAEDPSYDRLLNWSWTYDSAVAATAFAAVDLPDQAGRLLDQLAALQQKNGSIEFAFDVRTGESSASVRAGSIAFAAIAFNDYDSTFDSTLYLDNSRRAADYLLSLRNDEGLVRGGPDVKWVSTQHNILTLIALTGLAEQLEKQGDEGAASVYREAAEGIAKGIDSQLIVRGDELAHFRQGVNDEVVPLDTQALGVVYALFRGDEDLAKQVYEYAQQNFPIDGRSIELSNKPESYNMTYEAKGPFTGYRPYLGKDAPDVLWFEGTAEMRFVSTFLDQPTEVLDASMNSWWDVTRKQGLAPLGADRTVTDSQYNEYHVWPTAAAGAWTVLSGAARDTDWANPTLVK